MIMTNDVQDVPLPIKLEAVYFGCSSSTSSKHFKHANMLTLFLSIFFSPIYVAFRPPDLRHPSNCLHIPQSTRESTQS